MLPKGTILEFVKASPEFPNTVGIFNYRGRDIKMRYRSVIKQPSMNRLNRMAMDSVCDTVFGNKTEPDGHGPLGEPSWLLALSLI